MLYGTVKGQGKVIPVL